MAILDGQDQCGSWFRVAAATTTPWTHGFIYIGPGLQQPVNDRSSALAHREEKGRESRTEPRAEVSAGLQQGIDNLDVSLCGGPHQRGLIFSLASVHIGATREERYDRLYAALRAQRNRLERGLGAIAMTASIAPLLGLLGTVSGMITTFKAMTLFGAGDANVVSGGIAEALITTELGLVVAIPALLAHALMSRRVKSYFAQLENDAVQLSQLPLRTGEA